MKAHIQKLLGLATLLLSAALVNCGGSGSSSTPAATTPYNAYNAQCAQYANLPSCGAGMVMYNNQCISQQQLCPQGYNQYGQYGQYGYGSQYGYGYGTSGYGASCPDGCPAGSTKIQGQCMQSYTCGACYAYANGYCYAGDYLVSTGQAHY